MRKNKLPREGSLPNLAGVGFFLSCYGLFEDATVEVLEDRTIVRHASNIAQWISRVWSCFQYLNPDPDHGRRSLSLLGSRAVKLYDNCYYRFLFLPFLSGGAQVIWDSRIFFPLFGADVGVWRDFRLAHDNRREVGLGLLEVALGGEVK